MSVVWGIMMHVVFEVASEVKGLVAERRCLKRSLHRK